MQAAEGLAGLAAVAAANGDHERCAVLLGAAEHFGSGGQLTAQAELHRRFYQGASAALGSTAWRAGVRAGAQLDFAAAIEATTRLATPRAGGREGVA